jgi:hypothetical protein
MVDKDTVAHVEKLTSANRWIRAGKSGKYPNICKAWGLNIPSVFRELVKHGVYEFSRGDVIYRLIVDHNPV